MTNQDYRLLNSLLRALLEGEADALAATSNFVALLYNALPDINWLGVYVLRKDELVLAFGTGCTTVCRRRRDRRARYRQPVFGAIQRIGPPRC